MIIIYLWKQYLYVYKTKQMCGRGHAACNSPELTSDTVLIGYHQLRIWLVRLILQILIGINIMKDMKHQQMLNLFVKCGKKHVKKDKYLSG